MSARETGAFAHSANARGVRQGLREHLEAVAEHAAQASDSFGGAELARATGLWHDLGKYHPEWQRYLLESEAGTRSRGTGPDHKGAGAWHAWEQGSPLSLLIHGHHGGLRDLSEVKERASEWAQSDDVRQALQRAPPDLLHVNLCEPPAHAKSGDALEVFLRMLFSALVDADYLDTEHHLQAGRAHVRGRIPELGDLWPRLEAFHAHLPRRDDAVSQVRSDVYEACLTAATLPPGLFRLTVPTGGGKTLSAMAFALRHALIHGMRRVIVAVPYTTITEQTADVYRRAFDTERAVLEHHSAVDPANVDDQTSAGLWGRLASENWDAPVVVTTTVQLFESLFAASTSKCRKLHRIAGSVIVLDEAQALPTHLLAPMLSMLQCLAEGYDVSVVLCTATQPALDEAPGFEGLKNVREIAPDPPRLFAALRRVEYSLPGEQAWAWSQVADAMRHEHQSLAIVNTIADSKALFDALGDPEPLYLSTTLCGAHRRDVLKEVRRRLDGGEPCRVVSTQVVEAGVDLDFPAVFRAMGPLDRIVQAAGRCNREGRLKAGRVIVFRPEDGHMPPGPYKTGTGQTEVELKRTGVDLHDPALYHRYFRALFDKVDLDREHIQPLRRGLNFEQVAQHFKMIEDDTTTVLVDYDDTSSRLIEELREAEVSDRARLRALQPYLVSVRTRQLAAYEQRGLVELVEFGGIRLWHGSYDPRLGLTTENRELIV